VWDVKRCECDMKNRDFALLEEISPSNASSSSRRGRENMAMCMCWESREDRAEGEADQSCT
jgi:hypothetical protein